MLHHQCIEPIAVTAVVLCVPVFKQEPSQIINMGSNRQSMTAEGSQIKLATLTQSILQLSLPQANLKDNNMKSPMHFLRKINDQGSE